MTKFIVGYEEEQIVVTDTLADAEEFLLSIAEEEAYTMLIDHISYYKDDMETFVNAMNNCPVRKYFKTFNGMILHYASEYYWIHECVYLD